LLAAGNCTTNARTSSKNKTKETSRADWDEKHSGKAHGLPLFSGIETAPELTMNPEKPENPVEEKATAPLDTRLTVFVILMVLATLLAISSIWLANVGNGTGAIFSGIGSVSAFCLGQIQAGNPILSGITASIAGAGVGSFLTFYIEKAKDTCDQGTFANCGEVLNPDKSAWASLFGLPTALFALAFYAALALTLILSRKKNKNGTAATLLLFAGVGATTFSAFMAYQSKIVEGEWCTFCISLYAVAALCLISGIAACKATTPDTLKEALFTKGSAFTGPALLLFLAIIGFGASKPTTDSHDHTSGDDHTGDNIEKLYTLVDAPLKLSGKEPAKGSVNAEWTLVEFTDYSCGHCADQAPAIQALTKSHPRAKLLHKHYAFISEASILAAHAASCAHKQDRFWQMNEILFDNMKKEWTTDDLQFVAKEMLQLDEDAFAACMTDPATAKSVSDDYSVGEKAGVRATPALFLTFDGTTWLKMEEGTEGAALLLAAAENGTALPGLSPTPTSPENSDEP
jgi:uncharacterized membrane protein/thiol-disulfide isomerase/thioredoxin